MFNNNNRWRKNSIHKMWSLFGMYAMRMRNSIPILCEFFDFNLEFEYPDEYDGIYLFILKFSKIKLTNHAWQQIQSEIKIEKKNINTKN